jgi:peptide-methionine (S)-S-oxide reductase
MPFSLALAALFLTWIAFMNADDTTPKPVQPGTPQATPENRDAQTATGKHQLATFGGGCFWCTEAVFERLDGVKSVVSGYEGGQVSHPTYKQVCSGDTGHAEVIRIEFDPDQITFKDLLDVFWQAHDPTTLNRQGNDAGTQYRSVIYFHNDTQKAEAEQSKLSAAGQFKKPIVTEIAQTSTFYPAEDYHQDYFRNNPNVPYCAFVIAPKVNKLKKSGTINAEE